MTSFQNIIYEKKGRIAYVTINRPDRLNAVDPPTSQELLEAWTDFRDDDEVWVAILTGAGERAFSAGADLVAMAEARMSPEGTGLGGGAPFGGITRGFECYKPMIAAISGYCLAGGLEMALCCDVRIAAENAQFGLPEPTRAILPGAGGTQRLPRAIPLALAMELLVTGGRIDAQTALRMGLVSRVVPLERLLPSAEEVADAILQCGPLAVRAVKEAALRGLDMTLEQGLALEANLWREVGRSEDAREGPLAFAEKRKPEYKGR
ncbi:MAG: enoyl-CoA hydratase-related protein [Dehalococcoidia bacterium]